MRCERCTCDNNFRQEQLFLFYEKSFPFFFRPQISEKNVDDYKPVGLIGLHTAKDFKTKSDHCLIPRAWKPAYEVGKYGFGEGT